MIIPVKVLLITGVSVMLQHLLDGVVPSVRLKLTSVLRSQPLPASGPSGVSLGLPPTPARAVSIVLVFYSLQGRHNALMHPALGHHDA